MLERQGCSVSPMSSIVGPEGQAFDRLRVSNKGFAYILMKTELSFYLQTSIRPNKPLDPAAYTGWNNDRNFSLVIWDEESEVIAITCNILIFDGVLAGNFLQIAFGWPALVERFLVAFGMHTDDVVEIPHG